MQVDPPTESAKSSRKKSVILLGSVVAVTTTRMVCPLNEDKSSGGVWLQLGDAFKFESVCKLASLEVPAEFHTSTFSESKAPVVVVSVVRILNQKLSDTDEAFDGTTKVWDNTSFAWLSPPSHAYPEPERARLGSAKISGPAPCWLHIEVPCSKSPFESPVGKVPAPDCVSVKSSRPMVTVAVRGEGEAFADAE